MHMHNCICVILVGDGTQGRSCVILLHKVLTASACPEMLQWL